MIRICGSDRLLKYADGASSRGLRVSLLLQDGEPDTDVLMLNI
jgi:hypothetical protein